MHIDHQTLTDINNLLHDLGHDLDLTAFSGTMFSAAAIPIFLFLYLSTHWTFLLIPLLLIFALFLYFSFFCDHLKKNIRTQQKTMLYHQLLPSLLTQLWENYQPHIIPSDTDDEGSPVLTIHMKEDRQAFRKEMTYSIYETPRYRIEKKPGIHDTFIITLHTDQDSPIDGAYSIMSRGSNDDENCELVHDPVFLSSFVIEAEPTSKNMTFLTASRRDTLTSILEIAGNFTIVYEKDKVTLTLHDFSIFPDIKKGSLPHAIYEEDLRKTVQCLNLLETYIPRLL